MSVIDLFVIKFLLIMWCNYFRAMLSSKLLKERLNLLGKIGCAVCLLGSTVIVLHSPKEEEVSNMDNLALKMKDAGHF